jgi:hypothetical protein
MSRMTLTGAGRGGPPVWVPRGDGFGADIFLDFVNDRSWAANSAAVALGTILSCTRAGTATYTDAAGVVSDVGANTLRYGSAGLLVEESRVNLCVRSQEFNDAAWTKSQSSITADQTAAPDGTTTADLLDEGTATNNHQITSTSISFTSGTAYTFSIFLKQNTRRFAQLIIPSSPFPDNGYANFDLQLGTVTASGGTGLTAAITAFANGFYRCSVTMTSDATTSAGVTAAIITAGNAARGEIYLGTNGQIYVWGAQVEAGTFPTSYIRTTTASVTRSADNISFASTAGQLLSRGTWYAKWVDRGPISAVAFYVQQRVDGNNQINIRRHSDNKISSRVTAASSLVVQLNSTNNVVADTAYKAAFAYTTDDAAARYSASLGAAPSDDTTAAMPTGAFTTFVGSDNGSSNFANGYLQEIGHWTDRRISNTGLAGLVA